jgi:hypothetical protein
MSCPEKETLQRSCAEAWLQYEAAVKDPGLPIMKMIDPVARMIAAGGAGAFRLRWEHLRASHALSKHLVTHRC